MKQYLKRLTVAAIGVTMAILQLPALAAIPDNANDFIIAGNEILNYPYELKDNNGSISDQISPDADSDYLVDIDFEVNGLGNKAAYFIIYSANDSGGMRGKHLMDASIDENGNIGFLKTPLNTTGQATKDSCAEIAADSDIWLSGSAPISANEVVNIKAYICVDDKTVSYYVNNTLLDTIKLAAYKNVLPSGVGVFKDPSFQKIGHIFNIKKFAIYPAATEHLKRYEFRDYSGNKMTADNDGKYTSDIQKILITFAKDVDDELLNSFEFTDGNENVGMTVSVADAKTVELTASDMLKKDHKYFVKCSRAEISFSTNAVDKLSVSNIKFLNKDDNEIKGVSDVTEGIKLSADILNLTESAAKVIPVINVYYDGVLQATSKFEADAVDANISKKLVTDSILCDYKDGMYITGFLVSDTGTPLTGECVTGDVQITADPAWTVDYTYSCDDKDNGKSAFIQVFLPDKSEEDLKNSADISQVIAYRGLAKIENGKANIKFKLYDDPDIEGDAVSGAYTVYVSVEGKETAVDKITFSNKNEFEKVVNDINAIISNTELTDAEKISEIEKKVTENTYVLGVLEAYNDTNAEKNKIASLMYDFIKNESAFTPENAKRIINKAITIEAIAKGIYKNLFDYSDILELDNSKISALYGKDYITEELEQKITSAVKGQYNNEKDFYERLTEKFVLVSVEYADGIDYVKDILVTMCDEIGLDSTKLSVANSSVYTALSGKQYASYKALVTKFNSLYDEYNSGGKGSGSSSGKSSGSGGGISSITIERDKSDIGGNNSDIGTIPFDIFSDIDKHWAKNEIIKLAENGIISGKGDNKFCPDDNITREEFSKIISDAMFSAATAETDVDFLDLEKDRWSYPYVNKCCALGIISGYGNGLFGTADLITRQDLAVVVYNAMKKTDYVFADSTKKTFADENEISDYAKEAVNALYNNGLINGIDGSRFAPANHATRAEAAKIIYNVLNT